MATALLVQELWTGVHLVD